VSRSDEEPGPRISLNLRVGVLVLVALASASAYLTRHCLAVANTTIQAELKLNSEQMGYVFSLFALGYMIFQIPGGAIGQRIGTRNALSLFSVVWSIFTVWTSFVASLIPLVVSRFFFGCAQAGLVPNTAQIIKDWYPSKLHGSVSAMIGVAMSLGGAAAFWLTGRLMEHMHWRSVFQLYSLVGIAWAVAFWLVFRTRPEQHPWVSARDDACGAETGTASAESAARIGDSSDLIETVSPDDSGSSTPRVPLWKLLAHASIIWMCIQAPFRAAGYNLFVTYFPEFLERGHGLSVKQAADYSAWPLVGVIVGGFVGGSVIDLLQKLTGNRTLSRSGFACVSLLITTALTVGSAFASTPGQVVLMITVGAGFSGMASPAVWVGLIDLGGKSAAVVSGASNTIGCLAGVIFTPLVGTLVDAIKVNSEGTTGSEGWQLLILVHAGFYLCAALAFAAVRIPAHPVTEPTPHDDSSVDAEDAASATNSPGDDSKESDSA